MEPGTLLYTKDGRKSGNAIVTGSRHMEGAGELVFDVETDFGNHSVLISSEIEELYHTGPKVEIEQWRQARTMKLRDPLWAAGFERYMRVAIIPEPKCQIRGGSTGTLDLFGKSWEDVPSLKGEWGAIVIVDGGGACGPYRQTDLRPLLGMHPQMKPGYNGNIGGSPSVQGFRL